MNKKRGNNPSPGESYSPTNSNKVKITATRMLNHMNTDGVLKTLTQYVIM